MKFIDSFKVCVLAVATSLAFVACDKDEEKAPEYAATYAGDLVLSGEWNGKKMFEGTVQGELSINEESEKTVSVTFPDIVDLNAGRSTYSVKPFTVSGVEVKKAETGYTFSLENYEVEEVLCDQGNGKGFGSFNSTVNLEGTYNNGQVTVHYTFTLGAMPFPLTGDFTGNKK